MINRVAVFGARGMLGRAMVEELEARGFEVLAFTHGSCDIADERSVWAAFDGNLKFEAAINCAGARPGTKPAAMARVNTLGPHVLAAAAEVKGLEHLVHVSTDCVFNGRLSSYGTQDQVTPADLYGRTKAAGELVGVPWATTVRTSFIGPDHGLLRFLMDAEAAGERTIPGWRRAFWSGSTVWAVACGLADVLAQPPTGAVEHLATEEAMSKAAVLETLRRSLGYRVGILPADTPEINRILEPTLRLAPLTHRLGELIQRCRLSGVGR